MQRPTVVLPLPDSPTSATHWPWPTVNETSSTAARARAGRAVAHLQPRHLEQRLRLRRLRLGSGAGALRPALAQRQLLPAHAAHVVALGRLLEHGHRRAAALLRVLAAGRERAAGRPLADADRHAGDALQRARVAEVGDGRHQRPRVRVLGPLDHLVGGAVLDHAAGVHDRRSGRPSWRPRPGRGRRTPSTCRPRRAAAQLVQDAVLGEHVEAGGRLVQHRHRRLADAGHRDRHPLLLAARQLVGIAVAELGVGAQLDPLQRRAHASRPRPTASGARAARP